MEASQLQAKGIEAQTSVELLLYHGMDHILLNSHLEHHLLHLAYLIPQKTLQCRGERNLGLGQRLVKRKLFHALASDPLDYADQNHYAPQKGLCLVL